MNQLSPKSPQQKNILKNPQTKSTYFTKKIKQINGKFDHTLILQKKHSEPLDTNHNYNLFPFSKPTNQRVKKVNLECFKSLQKLTNAGEAIRSTRFFTKDSFFKNYNKQKSQYKPAEYSLAKLQDNSDSVVYKKLDNSKTYENSKFIDKSKQQGTNNIKEKQEVKILRRRSKSTHLSSTEIQQMEQEKNLQSSIPCNKFDAQRILNFQKHSFMIIKEIGSGKFSNVYAVVHLKTGFIGALKVIKKQIVIKDKLLLNQIIRQLKIHSFINNPSLIKLYGFFTDQKNLYLFQQLGSNGHLYSILKKKRKFTEQSTSFIIRNLLKALSYLHSNKILHRDIKPQNIIIIHGNIKICDFGCSVYTANTLRSTFCGSPLYISPEIVKGQKYNQTIDLWAIGILTYELFYGNAPFQIYRHEQIFKIVTQQVYFPDEIKISNDLKDFLEKILKKNPSMRLKCENLLTHPFIVKHQSYQVCEELCYY